MNTHLQECIYTPENIDHDKGIRWGGSPCICDRLRACEQRIREEESRNVIGSVSLAAIGEANLQQYQLGFATALDAARQAVQGCPMVGGFTAEAAIIRLPHALAAIDALREETK